MPNQPAPGFTSSIVSYPTRGSDGSGRYRGNTTGAIVEDFLFTYHPNRNALFVDPMEGGGTSRNVARRLGIRFAGFDLRNGFDAVRHDLRSQLDTPAASIFVHPPYAGMIPYSGNMWGTEVNPADLSACGDDIPAFLEALQAVLTNVHDALAPGGHYALLLGSWRTRGRYFPLPSLALSIAPGEIVAEIIKQQHNTTSARTTYRGPFVPIAHETLLIFRRAADGSIYGMFHAQRTRRDHEARMTWRTTVLAHARALARSQRPITPAALYADLCAHPLARANPNYRAKIRQKLQRLVTTGELARVSTGVYALAA